MHKAFTIRQINWAKRHDWFHKVNRDGSIQVKTVVVWPGGDTQTIYENAFTIHHLKLIAGY